jgi:hypothetical protein
MLQANDLPTSLRALRIGVDDDAHIRRAIHLAAAKIEDLEEQVTSLVKALEAASQPGGEQSGAGRLREMARGKGSGGEGH